MRTQAADETRCPAKPAPTRLRGLQAVEVLEHHSTPEAHYLLATRAQGVTAAGLTQEAKASRQRLAQRTGTNRGASTAG